MYDRTTAHVDCYMTGVTDDITRLGLGVGYAHTTASHRTGGMWQADTEVCIYGFDKSGTVRTIGQALAAPYIRVADKLGRIGYD